MSDRAVFLDKDGTLVVDVPYNVDPARVELAPGAGGALATLRDAGYRLFVVSNQSGVARGLFSEEDIARIEGRLRALFEGMRVPLEDFYYCPHHPEGSVSRYATACDCRKPAAGMLQRAAREHDVPLGASWMVGDILDDVEAGREAGCRTVLVDSGGETEWQITDMRRPEYVARDLLDAARFIVSRDTP
jgi:histidinol-phosphate phosphatase family protein